MMAADNVGVTFGDVVALDSVSLEVQAGEVLCLLGPSGSGKSTFLRVVAGLQRPTRGRVRLAGAEVSGPRVFVEPERRRVGMVFQDYALFPHMTVAANVAFGVTREDRATSNDIVPRLLDRLDLSRHSRSYPHMLSGGERQRVALARALATAPRLLLMDEPFSSLDGRLRDRVRRETVELLKETGTTTIVVTHDSAEALRIADRIALFSGGRLLQCGSVEEVYARPTSAFAARLFSDVNELTGTCRGGRVQTALGSFAAPNLPEGAAALVCIRPHHVRICDGRAPIQGRVTATQFVGEAVDVSVEVNGVPAPIAMRVSAAVGVQPGTMIDLDVAPDTAVVVPASDRAAE
jgi:iron(III) transport system ATP-binding protein